MQQHVTKLCADALRTDLKNRAVDLRSSHAHEIIAAFWGYKSKAAMNADNEYPISNLNQADIIIVPPSNKTAQAVYRQRQEELGISIYAFDEFDVYDVVINTLKNAPIYSESLEDIACKCVRDNLINRFKTSSVDPDQLNLAFEVTNSDIKSSDISITVSVNCISDNGVNMHRDSTMVVTFPRVAGYVGYKKPDVQETRYKEDSHEIEKQNISRPQWPYPAGTLVMRRDTKEIGIILESTVGSPPYEGTVTMCTDTSLQALLAKEEVFPLADQSINFTPLRLFIPYGKWVCPDGSEVLYNRDYRPLWKKEPGGTVIPIDSALYIEHDREKTEGYFNWESAPTWGDADKIREIGMSILKEWGVENKRPQILDLLPQAIAEGSADILEQKY